jgi:diguanylate cyclase (GGDEF)-like protein
MPRTSSREAALLARLSEITQDFGTLDLDRLASAALARIPALARARRASLWLYEYEAHELRRAGPGEGLPERLALKIHPRSMVARALETRKTIVVDGFAAWERRARARVERPFADRYRTETSLVVPLQSGQFLVGVLCLADRSKGDFAADVPVVEHLARILAMGIRNSRLFREVQGQAHTDALTGLRNYRAFHESLKGEIHRAQRYQRPLGLVALDIDGFKEINDHHGHPAGDVVLSLLGKVLRATVRREDLAARTGGDEIAVILPETGPEGSAAVAQRILDAVRRSAFAFHDRRLPVSVSVGHAQFRAGMTVTQFIEAADGALYRAKQAGKNRLAAAE